MQQGIDAAIILPTHAGQDNNSQVQMVGIELVRTREQVRKKRDPEGHARLIDSVKLHGILQPLLVRPDGSGFLLLAGEGRLLAAKAAGLNVVPIRIVQGRLAPGQEKVLQVVENTVRTDISDGELVQAVVEIEASNPDMQRKDIADQLSIDPAMVSHMFAVNESLCAEAKKAFFAGAFGLSIAYTIALKPENIQHEMLAARLEKKASLEDLKAIARKADRNGKSVKVASIKIALAGDIHVVVKGEAVDLESCAEALTDAVKQVKKAIAEQLDAKTAQAVWRDRAKAES